MLVKRFAACWTVSRDVLAPAHLVMSPRVGLYLRYSELLVENVDIFRPHLYLAAPQGVTPLEFREDLDKHKTRMNGLSCGEESMTICSAILIQYQRVTDGRTDVQPISITCFSIADAHKSGEVGCDWLTTTMEPCSLSSSDKSHK